MTYHEYNGGLHLQNGSSGSTQMATGSMGECEREREREKENKVRMRKKKEVSRVLTFYFNIIDGKFVDNDLMK